MAASAQLKELWLSNKHARNDGHAEQLKARQEMETRWASLESHPMACVSSAYPCAPLVKFHFTGVPAHRMLTDCTEVIEARIMLGAQC